MALCTKTVGECIKARLECKGREAVLQEMKQLQAAVYVMVGGGLIGNSAATQPAGFYVDGRVSKRPYSLRNIEKAVKTLHIYQDVLGITDMPRDYFDCHNCDVW